MTVSLPANGEFLLKQSLKNQHRQLTYTVQCPYCYTGESLYINEPAVRAGNIITANGFATLEFCREILYALEADSSPKIERSYRMNKTGVWEDPEVG